MWHVHFYCTAQFDMPCALDGIVQAHVAKLLGVFFSDKLGFSDHVNFVLDCLFSAYISVETVEKPGLAIQAATDSIYCPDTLTHYICSLSLGWPPHRPAMAAN